jgi:predicted DNA-binding transcriptional regulator AlpA
MRFLMSNLSAPLLLDIEAAAELAGISARHLEDLVKEGKAPEPVKLGRCRRWRPDVLTAWIKADCPPMAIWKRDGALASA